MSLLRCLPAVAQPVVRSLVARWSVLARGSRARVALVHAILGALAVLCLGAGGTGNEGVDEYQLKAAFLARFLKYVTWPAERFENDQAPFVVGVLGNDPFEQRLEAAFKNRKADERPVVVQRFRDLDHIATAHVLFVPASEAGRLEGIVHVTASQGVLLVGESPDFAAHGGVVNFYLEGEKLRFEINPESAKRQKLKVSSDLLRLARIVSDKG